MAAAVCGTCPALIRKKSCYGCGDLEKPCDTEKVWKGEIDCPRHRHHKPSIVRQITVDRLARESKQQPLIRELIAVTSLSQRPHHLKHQSVCLDSWKCFGLDIVSVNTAAEIIQLSGVYPQVSQWIERNDTSTMYDRPTQRINQLARVATDLRESILFVNSDIEIYGKQLTLLDRLKPNTLVAGIRYNYLNRKAPPHRERWGIDAFVLTPAMVESLPHSPLSIGKPVWDYWLPLHFRSLGYAVDLIGEPLFFHRSHTLHWNEREWAIGAEWLGQQYGEPLAGGGQEFRRSLG